METCHWRGSLESRELVGIVHVWLRVVRVDCFGAEGLGHVAGVAGGGRMVFVQGERVEGLAVRSCGLRAIVEYPDNLQVVSFVMRAESDLLTATMDSRMKPAAAASFAGSE